MPCHLTSLTGSRTTDPDRPRAVPSEIQDGTLSAYRRKDSRWRDFCHSLADRKICCMWTSRTSPNRFTLLVALATMMFFQSLTALKASPIASRVSDFTLSNGLRVVVVPDHRAPVVTHYVWYLAGSADDPPGTSGIAHFLEHLMFKSTDKMPSGEFSKIISRLGGQDNAFTTHDYTGYFQRIAKERLGTVMEMEADRMANLQLAEKDVLTERDVILEERRSRTENNPSNILSEQMSAALYRNHPYRIPIIGWMHEIAKLSRADALAFYKRFYAPNNAVMVVTGDVTADEVKTLAEATYGKIKANPEVHTRVRPQEPPNRTPRRVELKDARAGNASVRRFYLAPSLPKAEPGEAEALYLLMKIVGHSSTSRLYQRRLVFGARPRQRLDRCLRGCRQGRRPRQGGSRDRSRAARTAPKPGLGRRAGARQKGVHRRLCLRNRQPIGAGAALRRGAGARAHHRADQ